MRQVYGAIQLLHDTIENWVVKSEITPPPFQYLTDEERKFWEATHGRHLRWQRFSDGLESAEKITSVMDNLNTHNPGSLYEVFPPDKAKELWDWFEFVYTRSTEAG